MNDPLSPEDRRDIEFWVANIESHFGNGTQRDYFYDIDSHADFRPLVKRVRDEIQRRVEGKGLIFERLPHDGFSVKWGMGRPPAPG
jgi:hypothetical protein